MRKCWEECKGGAHLPPQSQLNTLKIKILHLLPRPWCLAEKLQARLYARVIGETADLDPQAQFFPTVALHEVNQDRLKCFAVQGIVGLTVCHSPNTPRSTFILR